MRIARFHVVLLTTPPFQAEQAIVFLVLVAIPANLISFFHPRSLLCKLVKIAFIQAATKVHLTAPQSVSSYVDNSYVYAAMKKIGKKW